jgi:hypothetical protein
MILLPNDGPFGFRRHKHSQVSAVDFPACSALWKGGQGAAASPVGDGKGRINPAMSLMLKLVFSSSYCLSKTH